MKVVIISDFSLPNGGASALALLETELLRKRGLPVLFVAGDSGANPMFEALGVSVVALGERKLLDSSRTALWRGLHNVHTTEKLKARLQMHDSPDTVYHVHGWSQILSPSLFETLRAFQGRVVITAHDFFLACPNGAYMDFRAGEVCERKPLSLACMRTNCDRRHYAHKLWRSARLLNQRRTLDVEATRPRVLMIHEGMREPLIRGGIPADRLTTLPNPVSAWSKTRIAAERNREFLFVGRFTEEKGPDLAALAAREAGVSLTLIGEGPLRERLQQAYPEFHFPGRLPPSEIGRLAASARGLLMPSRYPEPYGLVAMEAMWSGLPVLVARDALLAPDIVARGAGLAVDPRDTAAFAQALRAASDDVRLAAMSRAAFDRTRDLGLAPEIWADRLEDTFLACLNRPSSRTARLPTLRIEGVDAHVFDAQH